MDVKIRELLLKGYTINEIKYFLNLNDEAFNREFKLLVSNLENDTKLLESFAKRDDLAVGKIDINSEGTGYLRFGNKKYIIKRSELNGALSGDLVLVTNEGIGKNIVSKVDNIIERKDGLIVVNYVDGKFIPLNTPYDRSIDLSDEDISKIKPNDRLLIKVNDVRGGKVTATLETVIGHKDDIALREKTIAVENGFNLLFNETINKELEDIPDKVLDKDFKTHVDLRSKKVFTIDAIDTQDMDDALFYEKLPNGHHLVGIPISHISYYVKDNSAIFKEAVQRGTSLYLGEHSLPMFPRKLCNGIGSLNPNEDRLARTVLVEFDELYNIVDYKIIQSVIRSRKKMTYDDVDKILEHDSTPAGYENFYKELIELGKISDVLEKRKIQRGALNFYGNDIKVLFDNSMNPIGFKHIRQSAGRRLIENFALLANELYDEYSFNLGIKNINRIELPPDIQKMNKIIECLNACNFNFPEIRNINNQAELNRILETLKYNADFSIYSGLLLKKMQKAEYSTLELGHYGLALRFYAQFTSPIRRLGDFVNHKITDCIDLGLEPIFSNEMLETLAFQASLMEKNSDNASRQMLRIYMAEYMKNHIGEEFIGKITDENPAGIIIKTDNDVIGKVSPKNIMFGKYKYNSEEYSFADSSLQSSYHIGDEVIIKVKDVNTNIGTIDYSLIGHNEKSKTLKKVHKNKYKN